MSDNSSTKPTRTKIKRASYAEVMAVKSQIDATGDAHQQVALYAQLAGMLRWPRKKRIDMTEAEKAANKARRAEFKAQGLNPRTGLPYTPEQLAKLEARRTPEARAAASERAKGRVLTDEAKANIAAAAAKRKNRIANLEAKLAAMIALLASKGINVDDLTTTNESAVEAPATTDQASVETTSTKRNRK